MEKRILEAIGYTEPSDFYEFCGCLGDYKPEKGDKAGWAELFNMLRDLEDKGYVDIEMVGGRMSSFQLTEEGKSYLQTL